MDQGENVNEKIYRTVSIKDNDKDYCWWCSAKIFSYLCTYLYIWILLFM